MDYGIDAALACNKNGTPYVPGTLLTGKLREAWEELKELENFKPEIISWLGDKSDPSQDVLESTVLPQPKRLYINDLVLINVVEKQNIVKKQEVNYRIRLDSKTGSVEKGAYLVTERPFAPGDEITFQGTARFLAHNETEVDDLTRHLEIGLKWLSQLGADRTVGFGELINVKVEEEKANSVANTETLPSSDIYDFIIRPESPFCISEHHKAGNNLFKSSEIIPGGVIKGTLATMWTTLLDDKNAIVNESFDAERPELGEYFDKIRFTHAIPSDQQRTTQQPLSLVKANDDSFYDVALCEGAGLINGEAPAFSVDWKDKDYDKANQIFGKPSVKHEMRVRTKIDSEKRRSEDEKLFSYEMVVPTDDIAWYGRLDLSEVPEDKRPKVIEQFQSLVAQGLTGLGKTKAYAQIELLPANRILPSQPSNLDIRKGLWILTLQTPAILCHPNSLNHDTLHQAYASVFDAISDKSLELVRFFAKQSLAGGFYLWKRFQNSKDYQPYLLTDAGSVFVLKPRQEQENVAKKFIEKWSKTGLPLPTWAVDEYKRGDNGGDHWANCPYIPQNGYGEIAVNLSIHWDRNPGGKFAPIYEEVKK
jgi:CRISPR/Cas system CSM-associated protein Csm3 (group 7 of RAMP superfamily)